MKGNYIYTEDGEPVSELNPFPIKQTGSYVGYASDDKSVIAPNAVRGNDFLELDTKDVYVFDGSSWVVI